MFAVTVTAATFAVTSAAILVAIAVAAMSACGRDHRPLSSIMIATVPRTATFTVTIAIAIRDDHHGEARFSAGACSATAAGADPVNR